MKTKHISILAIAAIIYSCASKPVVVPPPVIAPTEEKLSVVPPPVEVQVATVSLPALPPSPADILQGKSLYENNCGKCHKLFATTQFSITDWQPIVKSMQGRAGLKDSDSVLIMAYLSSEAK